ncbi:MAG: hypothetical protein RSE46_24835, partial [Janthinobacterium sp.]
VGLDQLRSRTIVPQAPCKKVQEAGLLHGRAVLHAWRHRTLPYIEREIQWSLNGACLAKIYPCSMRAPQKRGRTSKPATATAR